jgi:hypothetical protein
MKSEFESLEIIISGIEAYNLKLKELSEGRSKIREDLKKIKEARVKLEIPPDLNLDYFII